MCIPNPPSVLAIPKTVAVISCGTVQSRKILRFVVDVWYPTKMNWYLCLGLLSRGQNDYSLTVVKNIEVKAAFKVKAKMNLLYFSEKLTKAVMCRDCDTEE